LDKRKFNGGHKTAGRKPKAEECKLIEKLTPLEPLAHQKLKESMEAGQKWAVQLYFNYMYGKPKETKDISINAEQPLFDF
jgi:hypothetical protein